MQNAYSPYDAQLATKEPPQAAFSRRKRLNAVAVALNAAVPPLVFMGLLALLSFSLHFHRPGLCWSIVATAFLAVVAACYTAFRNPQEQQLTWHTFAAGSMMLAVLAGTLLGDMNFRFNMAPFYEQEVMNSYPDVDVSKVKGQQLLDAGRVYFAKDTHLDAKKAMSFKNGETYCVVPIVHGQDKPASYDFWAVGVNCCGGAGAADFRCGAYNNAKALSGVRLLREDQRPFFRLAVQQAEAAYDIKATHPLFFEWVVDPIEKVSTLRNNGVSLVLISSVLYTAFNVVLVGLAVMNFAKASQL